MKKILVAGLLWIGLFTTALSQVGNVGINTTTPAAMLHVVDSSVLFSSTFYENIPQYDTPPPVSGEGVRLMWYPQRQAFRAGYVQGTQWDHDSIGVLTFATGQNTKAMGKLSSAFGLNTSANGYSSLVLGTYNDPVEEPETNLFPWTPLFIIGNGDSNALSNAMLVRKDGRVGIGTNYPAARLHVESESVLFKGPSTLPNTSGDPPVSGVGNRMMWYADKAALRAGGVAGSGWDNDSIGSYSVAFGYNNKAKGYSSFAGGGVNNTVSGIYAFVSGVNNTASGYISFCGGTNNKSSGDYSFVANGVGNKAESFGETVFGLYSTDYTPGSQTSFVPTDRLFVIGNGASFSNPSNAITVLKNGKTGFGTSIPVNILQVRGVEDAYDGPIISLGGLVADQVESGRIRFYEGTSSTNLRGGYIHLDGNANLFHIGVHPTSDNIVSNDISAIAIKRTTGEVGIGTTNPTALLEVNADIVKKVNGGSWTATSDRRLKQDIHDYREGLPEIMKIHPVTFHYNDLSGYDTTKEHIGVIAQELKEVAPHMVSTYDQHGESYLQVDNSAMTYMLINAIKDQQAIISSLHNQIEAQQDRLESLEKQMQELKLMVLQSAGSK